MLKQCYTNFDKLLLKKPSSIICKNEELMDDCMYVFCISKSTDMRLSEGMSNDKLDKC